MKTLWFPTLLIILFSSVKTSAQSAGNFTTFETIPCPFDAAKTIKAYKNWLIYQTMDGTWLGQIDSSRCISLANSPSEGILLQDVDLSRPVFLRSKFTQTSPAYLEKNLLYITYAGISWQSTNYGLLSGSNCPENLCSGIFVGIEIPDSTGLGTAIRWYTDIADSNTANGAFETCIPTEYFDYNYLKEFIIKLSFDSTTQSSAKIKMGGAGLDSWALNGYVYDIVAPEWTFEDTSYNVPVSYVATDVNGWNYNYLLMYNDIGNWPSSAHPSYVEGKPQNNTPDPKNINLIVSSGENLIAQPFTIVRGALVEGSDSIRHNVNIINDNGDICLGGIIDFIIGSGTKYVHKGGSVNFENYSACMMFREGGALEVADNTFFQYGQNGKGIMALRPGSTIRLGKGSTLLFDNLLWLQGIPTAQFPDHQFYMELNPGSTLSFTENANIYNGMSIHADTKLNIYMNGGILDDSKLKPEASALINRIYPKPYEHFGANLKLLQNPTSGTLHISYLSDGDNAVNIQIFDLNGRYYGGQTFQAAEGYNILEANIDHVPGGIYVAKIASHAGKATLKFAKIMD